MKRTLSTIIFTVIICVAFAQGDYEAFRFSQIDYQGTARFMGAGGSFSATGGEFSALSINPAAIGLYKRNEVTLTPLTLSFSNNNTLYNGDNVYSNAPKYTVPECGLVIANNISNSNWKTWQFGFGYNRIMDFNNTFRAQSNLFSTIISPILDMANGTNFQNLTGDANLAWATWIIDTIPGKPDQYFSPWTDEEMTQTAIVKTSGSIDEMTFTFGGNYNDKLYIGGSIGIPILDYTEKTNYMESPAFLDNIQGIRSCQITTTQKNSGGGINAKIGFIYQPCGFLRVGASFQSPTYFWKIKDTYNRYMSTQWTIGNDSYDDYMNINRFALSTPLKFNLAASFIIKQRGFISVEYDFTDYSMSRLHADNNNIHDNNWIYFNDANNVIAYKYGQCHTIRIGGEVGLTSNFLLRAGYNYKTSPYKLVENDYNASAHTASIGFGYRSKHFFCDLAYVLRMSNDNYTIFNGYTPFETQNTTHRIFATIGCKF